MAVARAVKDVFIVASKRTPFGTYCGKLSKHTATDLQEIATRAALEAGNIKPEWVNSIIIGNVFHATADGAYLPRHMGIRVGIPDGVPGHAVNRLCGSGFQSIISACQELTVGDSAITVTGGAENMSLSPHVVRGLRMGVKLGVSPTLEDSLWEGLTDQQIKTPMGITAENLAEKYNISREECDEFALRSQATWKAAHDAGHFKDEMVPITLKSKKGDVIFDMDEHPRPQTTMAQMSKLPPVFKKGGTVTAANASGICDGAGCNILATEDAIKAHNLTPLVRVAGYGVSGCDPYVMGIGPVPAIKALLAKTNLTLDQIPLIEVNEAFASQTLACQRELGIEMERLNTDGGAIALGHPVGASGARIIAHLAHKMKRDGIKYAIGSACIGGGQGIAILLENI